MRQRAPLQGCFAEVLLSHGRTLSSRFSHLDILRKLCKQFGTDSTRASHADAMLERTQNLRAWQRRGMPPRMRTVVIGDTLQSVLLSPKSCHWALAIYVEVEQFRHPYDFAGEKEESFQDTLGKTCAAIQSQVLLHVME